MAQKLYTKEFVAALPDIFAKKSSFIKSFGGQLLVKDGVLEADEFMTVKTSNVNDVVIREYNKDENTAFGTGTGKSSRFGERREIKSVNTQIKYDAPLVTNAGIDGLTVNDDIDETITATLAADGAAMADYIDDKLGLILDASASENIVTTLDADAIEKAFNKAHKILVNNNVSQTQTWRAYVNADVYSLIVDSKLTTSGKGSSVNIDDQTVVKFKGFVLEEITDAKLKQSASRPTGTNIAYFVADNVGIAGLGVQVARALDSEDFNGVAVQFAGKYARHIPEKNKKAVVKASIA